MLGHFTQGIKVLRLFCPARTRYLAQDSEERGSGEFPLRKARGLGRAGREELLVRMGLNLARNVRFGYQSVPMLFFTVPKLFFRTGDCRTLSEI